ncbi:hypothetical protein K437DRAFT_254334 [Tilletiaria anomala UBC 951]|uniref:Uncharacterized protein n=1 Tax=Tilletiaria anomala (strain ATCC 24038 / CBS 436.72 / UBC 951) TaxID=1037660 RepID=A0A066WEL1_TILAU|nr:uncharacterized protein K437DRAFT_254334 [Tilletiaria anomala UBC 951]KDN52352.1 hypothetical protein K437DRAFT_254334 [Tilletiaria anomala UBC 951]
MSFLCGIGGPSAGSRRYQRKILIVGDGACGKTSLLNVFTQGYFPQAYEPTVFESAVHTLDLGNGQVCELSLWDTAGQEDFDKLRSLSYSDTHCVIICFSVDRRISLENVENKWVPELQENCPGVKVVLAALKCDLRSEGAFLEKLAQRGETPVDYEDGLAVAKRIRAARYLECSAKCNRGVEECFVESTKVAIEARARRKEKAAGENGISCTIT